MLSYLINQILTMIKRPGAVRAGFKNTPDEKSHCCFWAVVL